MGGLHSSPVTSMRVIDRRTGAQVDENVPLYLLGLYKAMYENPVGRWITSSRFMKNALRSQTSAHGSRMDHPSSAASIQTFVATYNIDVTECEKPLSDYATLNDFFARRLKPGARPIEGGVDDRRLLVSPADCRLVVYPNIASIQRVWLKGQTMNVETMLGREALDALQFDTTECCVAVARLAPNDYHRWHMPFRATQLSSKLVEGTYYSVSPRAVRNSTPYMNVLTDNKRLVCVMDSSEYGLGRWALVAVGAAMVSSIQLSEGVSDGNTLEKGQEHGYFQFGGSTLVLVMDTKRVAFDEDIVLLSTADEPMEMLVRVGEAIGKRLKPSPPSSDPSPLASLSTTTLEAISSSASGKDEAVE